MKLSNDLLKEELERIRLANGGLLYEEIIVAAATSEGSPLHAAFTWDDSAAAEKWRLEEARTLIRRVYVRVERPESEPVTLRMYASLGTDRLAGGGYRAISDILSDSERCAELLKTALAELQAMQARYSTLAELAPVFEATEKVKQQVTRQRGRGKQVSPPAP